MKEGHNGKTHKTEPRPVVGNKPNGKSQLRTVIAMVAIAVIAGGTVTVLYHGKEPRYQGRFLSEWIATGEHIEHKLIVKANDLSINPTSDPSWQAVSHAVKEMGHDGIDRLLKWAKGDDSLFNRFTIDLDLSSDRNKFNPHFRRHRGSFE